MPKLPESLKSEYLQGKSAPDKLRIMSDYLRESISDGTLTVSEIAENCTIGEDYVMFLAYSNPKDCFMSTYDKLLSYIVSVDDEIESCLDFIKNIDEDESINQDKNDIIDENEYDFNFWEFIDIVNSYLPEECKIDNEDAIEAKHVFDEDLKKEKYDKAAREVNFKLFGTYDDISSLPFLALQCKAYNLGLLDDVPYESWSDKMFIMSLLYKKLGCEVEKYLSDENNQPMPQVVCDDPSDIDNFGEYTNCIFELYKDGEIPNC